MAQIMPHARCLHKLNLYPVVCILQGLAPLAGLAAGGVHEAGVLFTLPVKRPLLTTLRLYSGNSSSSSASSNGFRAP
jgi:hypothetical protein